MTASSRRLLYWAPRILSVLFAAFLATFALDVFDEKQGIWRMTTDLLIHLLPTWLVLLALAVSWRREWVGAILFLGLGVAYLMVSGARFYWTTYAVICGPLALTAILFLLNWRWREELRPRRS